MKTLFEEIEEMTRTIEDGVPGQLTSNIINADKKQLDISKDFGMYGSGKVFNQLMQIIKSKNRLGI